MILFGLNFSGVCFTDTQTIARTNLIPRSLSCQGSDNPPSEFLFEVNQFFVGSVYKTHYGAALGSIGNVAREKDFGFTATDNCSFLLFVFFFPATFTVYTTCIIFLDFSSP